VTTPRLDSDLRDGGIVLHQPTVTAATPHRRRRLGSLLVFAAALLLTSCGSDTLSLTDYAERVETEVTVMNTQLDDLLAELESEEQSVASTRAYFEGAAAARARFVTALEDLTPPQQAQRLHDEALAIVRQLRDANETLAALVATYSDPTQLASLDESPEVRALEAIDAKAVEMCHAAEASIDATSEREDLRDVAWLPSELKEVVEVAFRCTAAERGGTNG
jgi:hypothetical protein